LPANDGVATAAQKKDEPAANFVYVYLNSLPALYEISTPESKRKQQAEVREWLLRTFQADLDDKVERTLSTGTFGPLPLLHEFVKFMPELLQLYINGLYYSTIALAGVTAERFCFDLVNMAEFRIDGKMLSKEEKQAVMEMRFADMIDLLSEWSLIQDCTKSKLHEIRKIRNRYVHPNPPPFDTAKNDAKHLVELTCEIARIEFGPNGTGRYVIDDGALTLRPRRAATS
jgi:hypothetical protein